VEIIFGALRFAVYLYLLVLFARVVISWVMVISREWRPTGVSLVIVEGVYSLTDPPLRKLRTFLPSVRLGMIQIDLAFLALFFGCYILLGIIPA
jgi:YggT family protein